MSDKLSRGTSLRNTVNVMRKRAKEVTTAFASLADGFNCGNRPWWIVALYWFLATGKSSIFCIVALKAPSLLASAGKMVAAHCTAVLIETALQLTLIAGLLRMLYQLIRKQTATGKDFLDGCRMYFLPLCVLLATFMAIPIGILAIWALLGALASAGGIPPPFKIAPIFTLFLVAYSAVLPKNWTGA